MKQIQKNRKRVISLMTPIQIFIPGYIIENSESVENVSDSSSEDESAAGMAYREEPLADQEWLENYKRQENERLELKEKLERRLDGSVQISEW